MIRKERRGVTEKEKSRRHGERIERSDTERKERRKGDRREDRREKREN
mgnify:FL=1